MYINNLINSLPDSKKLLDKYILIILRNTDNKVISDILIHSFLTVLTFQSTDNHKNDNVHNLSFAIWVGKKLVVLVLRFELRN
jgi:hypothetical protein